VCVCRVTLSPLYFLVFFLWYWFHFPATKTHTHH
jgi:hypothetical protein